MLWCSRRGCRVSTPEGTFGPHSVLFGRLASWIFAALLIFGFSGFTVSANTNQKNEIMLLLDNSRSMKKNDPNFLA